MRYSKKKATTQILTFRTVVIALIIVLVGGYAVSKLSNGSSSGPDERVALAQCLTENDVKMYGAYWCPHCARQKEAFGKAFKDVTYVECAIPGNRADQTEACRREGISGYPTWVFADGSRQSGEMTLTQLAERAGCAYGTVQPTISAPETMEGEGSADDEAMETDDSMMEDDGTAMEGGSTEDLPATE